VKLIGPALLALGMIAAPLGAQTLVVTVVDQATGRPVRGARVQVAEVATPGRTGGDGIARLDGLPAGNRIVQVSRIGYTPERAAVDLAGGSTTTHTFSLRAEPVPVAGVSVRLERRDPLLDQSGFYHRMSLGGGSFMTDERIWDIRPTRTIDLFRHMRGYSVTYDRRGNPNLVTTHGPSSLGPQCRSPLLYLDGRLFAGRGTDVTSALEAISPETIKAVEAYAGPATIPAEYNPTGSACGVVLVWTKHGPG
jgi:hypothetical protein